MKNTKNTVGAIYEFIELPSKILIVPGKTSQSIAINTPDKGIVFIDCEEDLTSMFGANRRVDKKVSDILSEINKIKRKASEYLMKKWVEENKNF